MDQNFKSQIDELEVNAEIVHGLGWDVSEALNLLSQLYIQLADIALDVDAPMPGVDDAYEYARELESRMKWHL